MSGVLKCGDCGRALIGQASHGANAVHRYYGHKQVVGETIKCKIKRFRAEEIETAVENHLSEILLRSGHLDGVEENLKKSLGVESRDLLTTRDQANQDLALIEKDIESAFKLHGQMGSNSEVLKMITEKLEQLGERKRKLVYQLDAILLKIDESADVKEARRTIEENAHSLKRGWLKATPSMKKRLVRNLVDRLVYAPSGLHAYYHRTAAMQSFIQLKSNPETSENASGVSLDYLSYLQKRKSRPGGQLLDACASVVGIGGGCPNLCEPEPLTVKVVIAGSWRKEQIDLAELARLRWVERWRIERLAGHFDMGGTTLKVFLRQIRAKPAIAGLSSCPPAIRGT